MSELTLLLLRIGFLILLWAFVFAIVYALRSDLFGTTIRRFPAPAKESGSHPAGSFAPPIAVSNEPRQPAPDPHTPAGRLVVTSGAREGLDLPLENDELTIGRAADSGLVIRDDYTSTHHARLVLRDGVWMIEDLGSTNGTFLNGTKVTRATAVPLNTPISIGTTIFELRR